MNRLLLKNGRVVDPSRRLDKIADILLEDGLIVDVASRISHPASRIPSVDLKGLVVAPGFVDIHVHFREPGIEEAETIDTGALAAAAGGFTAVACMPNTKPCNDNERTNEFILHKAGSAKIAVYPIAAITKDEAGEHLVDFAAMKKSGAVAFSDDGKPVANSHLMREALEAGKALRTVMIDHCEDPFLFKGGTMNEGVYSQRLKVQGIPNAAEEIMVARNIALAKLTGSHVHMAHMSTAGSMDLIRHAKKSGVPVTAEVTPHHFTLTDKAVTEYGTHAKMNPPLRSKSDLSAVLKAIADGTVDVIASDHAPHHVSKKNVPLSEAAFGIIGLETSVSLGLDRLVNTGLISMKRFVELYSLKPAGILGIQRGIAKGVEANLTVLHPTRRIKVDASKFQSKSRNTPFDQWKLRGCPAGTIYKGEFVWMDQRLIGVSNTK